MPDKPNSSIGLSAEFKRDYIAFIAISSFVVILIAEVALAVGIPWYLHREDTMANQVARLEFLDKFDRMRGQINRIHPKDDTAEAEIKLVSWNLNLLADYLRKESAQLTMDEIKSLNRFLDAMATPLASAKENRPVSVENKLDTSKYVNGLIPKKDK
ncbi:MAG: hypothetical protein MJ025_01640 [Victivallaceae bacterium]|nr:hypothetical protein [Victivallaceae bacterium]